MRVIYDWETMPEFLAFAVLGSAFRIAASVADSAVSVLPTVPHGTGVFLYHLNCTHTTAFPADRDVLTNALRQRGVLVLNSDVTDISKRSIHRRLSHLGMRSAAASITGPPDELLIVKTDSNYGGESEQRLSEAQRVRLGIRGGTTVVQRAREYQVMKRRAIPAEWWTDDGLVIERYVRNTSGTWYRAYFLLSRLVLVQMRSEALIKKVGGSERVRHWMLDSSAESLEGVPPGAAAVATAVSRFRQDAGLDFGAIDIVVDDVERFCIIDVNSTPAYFHPVPHLAEYLAGALPGNVR